MTCKPSKYKNFCLNWVEVRKKLKGKEKPNELSKTKSIKHFSKATEQNGLIETKKKHIRQTKNVGRSKMK